LTTYNATWIRRVAWSPDGTQLSTGSGSQGQGDGEELFLWDAQSGERVCTLAGHPGMAGCAELDSERGVAYQWRY